jgi:hypothetical protein
MYSSLAQFMKQLKCFEDIVVPIFVDNYSIQCYCVIAIKDQGLPGVW